MPDYSINTKIQVENEGEYKKQLNTVNDELKVLKTELNKVSSEFVENANSEEALIEKNKVLSKTLEKQEQKLMGVKQALENAKNSTSDNEVAIRRWQKIINNTEADINNLRSTIKKNEDALDSMESEVKQSDDALDKLGKTASDSSGSFSKLASGIGTGVKVAGAGIAAIGAAAAGAVAAINDVTESTREYREDMGKLTTAFKTAGFSQDTATKTYKEFFSVLGEEDRSVEAVNHLAKLTTNQKDLQKWTDIAAGVWGTFGDSLPIEGLTEAANETAKTGTVMGVLADALNWAGVSEDEFNSKLQALSSEQERASLITDTLNGLYKEAAVNYREANAEIIAAQKAQSELTDATAKMGKALEPVSTSFKLIGANILNDLAPGVELIGEGLTGAINQSSEAAELLGAGIESVLEEVLESIDEILPIFTNIIENILPNLLESIIEMLPELGVAATEILLALVDGLLASLPSLLEAALQIILYLASAISEALPELIPAIVEVIGKIVEVLTDPETLVSLVLAAVDIVIAIVEGISDNLDKIMDSAELIIENLITAIILLLPELIPVAFELIGKLASGLIQANGELVSVVPRIIRALFNALGNVKSQARQWGKDFVQNLVDGIKSMIEDAGRAAKEVANRIANFLHFSVPDEGPLRSVPEWMPDMIDLMTEGMKKNEKKLRFAARNLAYALDEELGLNANIHNVGYSESTINLSSPVYLDGIKIAENTQRVITRQQTTFKKSKGVA